MNHSAQLPPVYISPSDFERLHNIGQTGMKASPAAAELLLRELDRATLARHGTQKAVGIGTPVLFRDESTGRERKVQVVFPNEADPMAGKISILTPIGAALIGLTKGHKMAWLDGRGNRRELRVLEVDAEIEPAGYINV